MSSRSDHGIRLPRADAGATPRRSRVATSLPEGLPHYELRRVLRPIENEPALWEHAIEHDDDFVPLLAESSPPPFDPIDPAMILGAPSPIEIEIGTGKGGFLSGYAQLHPERPILGIEWTRPIAWYAAQKFTRRPHLTHAKVLWADANFFLRDRMPRGLLQTRSTSTSPTPGPRRATASAASCNPRSWNRCAVWLFRAASCTGAPTTRNTTNPRATCSRPRTDSVSSSPTPRPPTA